MSKSGLPSCFYLKFLLILWFGIVGLLGLSSTSSADAVNQLYAFLKAQTFKSDFTQKVYDAKQSQIDDSKGVLIIERPGRFRWEYFSPSSRILVSDGINFIIHDPELKQMIVRPLAEALAYAPIMMLARVHPDLNDFEYSNEGYEDGLDWVHLVPKVKDMEFVRIELGLMKASIRTMRALDHFDQWTIIQFNRPQSDLEIDPLSFRVYADQDTDVVGEFTQVVPRPVKPQSAPPPMP